MSSSEHCFDIYLEKLGNSRSGSNVLILTSPTENSPKITHLRLTTYLIRNIYVIRKYLRLARYESTTMPY